MIEIVHFQGGIIDGHVSPAEKKVDSAHWDGCWYDRVEGSERVDDGVVHVDLVYRPQGMGRRAARRRVRRKDSL